ncbi:8226_t:CDS:2, partial [Entrophospora sp. SA101]
MDIDVETPNYDSVQVHYLNNQYTSNDVKFQVLWIYILIRVQLAAEYDLNDVYNADKTALYWKLEPNKTFSSEPITGTKKPRYRIKIMLSCNAT